MAVSTRDQEVLDALRVVQDPDLHRDIVSLGFVQNMHIEPTGAVAFNINLTTPPARSRTTCATRRAWRSPTCRG